MVELSDDSPDDKRNLKAIDRRDIRGVMKIAFQQFLGLNHSWSLVGRSLARAFLAKNNEVHLHSTNGYQHFPKDLESCVKNKLENDYDLQLSYTIMKNFPLYLSHGKKNRFGIWSIEFDHYFPYAFAKYAKTTDAVLVPSEHTRRVFLEGGVSEELLSVVPHGVDEAFYSGKSIFALPKKYDGFTKILINVAQPHRRKNVAGALEMYGKAFSKKDEVVLILKAPNRKPTHNFDVSIPKLVSSFKAEFPEAAPIYQIDSYIEDISSLYRACDIYFFPSKAEAFSLSPAEAIASKMITITSEHGGALDFCNAENSLLIPGKLEKADPRMLYWGSIESNIASAQCFAPNVEAGVEMLREAVRDREKLSLKFQGASERLKEKYTWDKVADQILRMVQ